MQVARQPWFCAATSADVRPGTNRIKDTKLRAKRLVREGRMKGTGILRLVLSVALLVGLATVSALSQTGDFPSRPIRMLSASAPAAVPTSLPDCSRRK